MGANASKSIAEDFKSKHADEIPSDGVLRVCVGGGAGFIGQFNFNE